jgi:hypothetical protein
MGTIHNNVSSIEALQSRLNTLNDSLNPIIRDRDMLIHNFKLLEEDFDNNINLWHCKSMIWAITFSKLDKKLKTQKIQKYYNEKTHKTMLLACKRDKNLDLYKWLLTQA